MKLMKKILIKNAAFISGCLFLFACSGNNSQTTSSNDANDLKADSIAAEQAKIEELRNDSLMNLEIDKQFESPLSITTGKAKTVWPEESSVPVSTMPYTIHNNTDVPFTSEDYKITYSYVIEEDIDGMLEDVTKKGKSDGIEVDANSDAEGSIKLKGSDIKNVKVEINISKEEFTQRFKTLKNK